MLIIHFNKARLMTVMYVSTHVLGRGAIYLLISRPSRYATMLRPSSVVVVCDVCIVRCG